MRFAIACLMILPFAPMIQAQQPVPPAKRLPRAIPAIRAVAPVNAARWTKGAPTLADLVLAKVDIGEAGPHVIMMVESYRTERKMQRVTFLKQEQRTREVFVDGKKVTQEYIVNVPTTEETEVNTKVSAGRKPLTLPGNDVRFFNLDGQPVSIDEAAETLTSLRPVFLIDQSKMDPQPMSGLAKRAINENCLIAVTEQQVRSSRNVRWAAPQIPAARIVPALKP